MFVNIYFSGILANKINTHSSPDGVATRRRNVEITRRLWRAASLRFAQLLRGELRLQRRHLRFEFALTRLYGWIHHRYVDD